MSDCNSYEALRLEKYLDQGMTQEAADLLRQHLPSDYCAARCLIEEAQSHTKWSNGKDDIDKKRNGDVWIVDKSTREQLAYAGRDPVSRFCF